MRLIYAEIISVGSMKMVNSDIHNDIFLPKESTESEMRKYL